MVKLYCRCGYPIWITARWDGQEIVLLLHDGQHKPERHAIPLNYCPKCGERLSPGDLQGYVLPLRLEKGSAS